MKIEPCIELSSNLVLLTQPSNHSKRLLSTSAFTLVQLRGRWLSGTYSTYLSSTRGPWRPAAHRLLHPPFLATTVCLSLTALLAVALRLVSAGGGLEVSSGVGFEGTA